MSKVGRPSLNLTPKERRLRRLEQKKKAYEEYTRKLKNNPDLYKRYRDKENSLRKLRRRTDPKFTAKISIQQKNRYIKIKSDPAKLQQFKEKGRTYYRKRSLQLQAKKAQLQKLLGGRCVSCDIDNPVLLDFDHLDPSTKTMNITDELCKPIENLIPEVMKCQLLCANCHRLKTLKYGEYDAYKFQSKKV
mgnify:CR=1 FL=1